MCNLEYVIFLTLISLCGLSSTIAHESSDHVCITEERYVELEQVKTTQPVQVRSYNWCLSYPPRCTNYHTEIKEAFKLQNVTKTRMITFCCPGYAEVKSVHNATRATSKPESSISRVNQTLAEHMMCRPVCRGGCGKGICQTPNGCKCDLGYEGRHCNQRCRYGMWGDNCNKHCKCRNGSLCDNKSGFCRCTEGWIGEHCETPCPTGHHGVMCKSVCECASRKCNHINGECLFDDSYILFDWDGGNGHNSSNDSNSSATTATTKVPTDRIKAKHWIQIKGDERVALQKCNTTSNDTSLACDWNNQDVVKLKSSDDDSAGNNDMQADGDRTVAYSLIGMASSHRHDDGQHQLENNTVIINTLHSSIANLTDNIGKLSKQVNDQRLALQRDHGEQLARNTNVSYHWNNDSMVNMTSLLSSMNDVAFVSVVNGSVPSDATWIASDVANTDDQPSDKRSAYRAPKLENLIALSPSEVVRSAAVVALDSSATSGNGRQPIVVQAKLDDDAIIEKGEADVAAHNAKENSVLHIITGLNNVVAAAPANPPAPASNANATKIEIHQHDSGPQYVTPIVLILILITLLVFAAIAAFYICHRWHGQTAMHTAHITSPSSAAFNHSEPELIAISKLEQKPLPGIPTFHTPNAINSSQCQVGMNANGIAVPMTSNGSGSVAVAIAPMNDNGHLMYRSDKADFSQRRRYSAADHIYDEIIYPACNNEQTSKS